MQFENLRATQQSAIDGEERIAGGCPDQGNRAGFYVWQQSVLLRAVESVDFVDEQDGSGPCDAQFCLRPFERLTQFFDSAGNRI